jgi:hypothetical protein
MQPRIYTYKITFEEVPYYYYGVKKEKYYNQEYWGSPITHKWCWELYTPKKQILEIFDYSDEGWIKAQEVEKRLIRPVFNTDKWCLNENCGGVISLDTMRKTGKRNGTKLYEEGRGIHALTSEEKRERATKLYKNKKGIHAQTNEEKREFGKRTYQMGVGVHAFTKEQLSENGKRTRELGIGIYALTTEQRRENGKKSGKKCYEMGVGIHRLTTEERRELVKVINSQRWKCLETGYISTAAGVVAYQRARGIDTTKRERLE